MKKLTKKEQESYTVVQRIRGKESAKKAGTGGRPTMSERGKKGSDARWSNKK